jgi:hypothetical protein
MAQEPKAPPPPSPDAVEKFLTEKKAFDDRRQELIKELLQQKEAAIKSFDEKLAKLGYDGARPHHKRSHHKPADDKKAS